MPAKRKASGKRGRPAKKAAAVGSKPKRSAQTSRALESPKLEDDPLLLDEDADLAGALLIDQQQQNGSASSAGNSTNAGRSKNESERIAELEQELKKAENSKRILYNALVRERSLNNDKPSVASAASKSGLNFCKPYSTLSVDLKQERLRLLASIVAEFADPKNTSQNKAQEVRAIIEGLNSHWEKSPSDFQ